MGVCALRQTKFLLGGVVEHGTTLVSALAKGLRPDRRVSPKKQREMVSRHLGALDILPALQDVLCARTPLPAGTPVAVDCSDLSKAFGGDGMEGMEWGHVGSTGGKSMGHLFVSAATVPGAGGVARPFGMKLAMGKHGAPGLVAEAVRKVGDLSGKKAIGILDRGGDGMPTLRVLVGEGHRSVVRIAKMDRDVFGTGRLAKASFPKRSPRRKSCARLPSKGPSSTSSAGKSKLPFCASSRTSGWRTPASERSRGLKTSLRSATWPTTSSSSTCRVRKIQEVRKGREGQPGLPAGGGDACQSEDPPARDLRPPDPRPPKEKESA